MIWWEPLPLGISFNDLMNITFRTSSKWRIICVISIVITTFSCKTNKKLIEQNQGSFQKEKTVGFISEAKRYIHTYKDWAIREMKTYGIPASIKLAQGILESNIGKSRLATKANNHFGIKCHSKWKGQRIYHNDDRKAECFRSYSSPLESYTDHSKFLKTRKRYSFLFHLKSNDYKAWAYGLKRAGYATDKKYPMKLIAIIKKYQLYKYDGVTNHKFNNHKVRKWILVRRGDTLYSLSKKHNLSVSKLKKINRLNSNQIRLDQILYIE